MASMKPPWSPSSYSSKAANSGIYVSWDSYLTIRYDPTFFGKLSPRCCKMVQGNLRDKHWLHCTWQRRAFCSTRWSTRNSFAGHTAAVSVERFKNADKKWTLHQQKLWILQNQTQKIHPGIHLLVIKHGNVMNGGFDRIWKSPTYKWCIFQQAMFDSRRVFVLSFGSLLLCRNQHAYGACM